MSVPFVFLGYCPTLISLEGYIYELLLTTPSLDIKLFSQVSPENRRESRKLPNRLPTALIHSSFHFLRIETASSLSKICGCAEDVVYQTITDPTTLKYFDLSTTQIGLSPSPPDPEK